MGHLDTLVSLFTETGRSCKRTSGGRNKIAGRTDQYKTTEGKWWERDVAIKIETFKNFPESLVSRHFVNNWVESLLFYIKAAVQNLKLLLCIVSYCHGEYLAEKVFEILALKAKQDSSSNNCFLGTFALQMCDMTSQTLKKRFWNLHVTCHFIFNNMIVNIRQQELSAEE